MKLIYIYSLLFLVLIISCADNNSTDNKLFQVYEDIAVARERIDDKDSATVAVDSILKSYGYDEPKFRQEIFELRKDNPEEFIQIIDSVKKNAMKRAQVLDSLENLKLESESEAATNSKE